MRVVVPALCYFPERRGGSSRLAYDEARYFVARGHEVYLVAQATEADSPEFVVDEGLHVLRYRRPRFAQFDARRVNGHQKAARQLMERRIGGAVDLVHGHGLHQYAAALDLYGGRARTCYSVHSPVQSELRATANGASLTERLRLSIAASRNGVLERRCLLQSNAVTAESEFTRTLLRELHGDEVARRVQVVPGWADLDRFQLIEDRARVKRELGWPVDRPVLFCLRRLVPRMGLDRLLHAVTELLRDGTPPFVLVIGGTGPLREPLERLAEKLGISSVVRFAGSVSDAQVPLMFGAADAFVLPTAELECFGLIALEALACGRPVLATNVGAIPEVVGRIDPRFLARDPSPGAIAALLRDYLSGRLPEVPPASLRRFVERHYAMEHVIRQLEEAVGRDTLTEMTAAEGAARAQR